MTEKRFTISSDNNQNIYDTEEKCYYSSIDAVKLCDLLNDLEQEARDNEHYHSEVLRLYKAVSEENEHLKNKLKFFNELNKPYGDIIKDNEQLKKQINKLEAQLFCPFDSICIRCNNEYLVQKEEYYVSKCKKGHEQCSKVDVKYCEDFEIKGDLE